MNSTWVSVTLFVSTRQPKFVVGYNHYAIEKYISKCMILWNYSDAITSQMNNLVDSTTCSINNVYQFWYDTC